MSDKQTGLGRNFLLLWQAQTVSSLGNQAYVIAVVFWLKHATESPGLVGLMGMIAAIPAVLLSPLGGTLADMFPRRTLIILADVVCGLAVTALGVALYFFPRSGTPQVVGILLVALILSTMGSFFFPAVSAAIPDLVPVNSLEKANSLMQGTMQLAALAGQAAGGILFRVLGGPLLLVMDGATYLLSAWAELFIRIPQKIPPRQKHWRAQMQVFKKDTVDGLSFVWSKPGLKEFVGGAALLNFLAVPVLTMMPFFVEDVLKLKADWYGFLLAANGAGALIGYVLAGGVGLGGIARGRLIMILMFVEASVVVLLSLNRNPFVALGLSTAAGFAGGFIAIAAMSLLQLSTPSELRGRVLGFVAAVGGALSPLAMGLSGLAAELLGRDIAKLYLCCGALMALLAIALPLMSAKYRDFLQVETGPAVRRIDASPIPSIE